MESGRLPAVASDGQGEESQVGCSSRQWRQGIGVQSSLLACLASLGKDGKQVGLIWNVHAFLKQEMERAERGNNSEEQNVLSSPQWQEKKARLRNAGL